MKLQLIAILALLMATLAGFAEDKGSNQAQLPPKKKLHIYLLMGQSNMVGRGAIDDEDKQTNPRVLSFTRSNVWQVATEPLHAGSSAAGVGPGLTFGKRMAADDASVTIGLVPCAVGGTLLSRWSKGGDLYSNAVSRAKLAMKDGILTGVVWHQGENDSILEETAKTYGERLQQMFRDLREELGQPNLPIVVGEIGEFLYTRKDPTKTPYAKQINAALDEIPEKVPNTACIKASGLSHKGDEVHFDTKSQHELGRRFAEAMLDLHKRTTSKSSK